MFKALSLFLIATASIVKAGECNANTKCPNSAPCCSEYGECGISPLHCGGGCQSAFSYSSTAGDKSSCYADRPATAPQCISGKYDFSNTTWVMNTEAYNGDPHIADFLVDNAFKNNVRFGSQNSVQLLLPQATNDNKGGVRLSSTSYLTYGVFSVKIRSGATPGMVTSFISMSDVKDEIDWEWTGGLPNDGQSNFFHLGVIDYTNSKPHDTSSVTAVTEHEYTVDWNADRIQWLIDGRVVRTTTAASVNNSYPTTASRIQLAVWDGGYGGPEFDGRRKWAGGYIDWSKPLSDRIATVSQVTIQCPGDPIPTGPPARKQGYRAPTLNEADITDALAGTTNGGYYPPGTSLVNRKSSAVSLSAFATVIFGFVYFIVNL